MSAQGLIRPRVLHVASNEGDEFSVYGDLDNIKLKEKERQIEDLRKAVEYHHADRQHYAVLGTPNRLEYDQGFFVKGGDGLADIKPIAHLYKTQVYQLAAHYGVPSSITDRPPSTGTYSLPQSQGEFYFSLEPRDLDIVLYALDAGLSPSEPAQALGRSEEEIEAIYRDLRRKRTTTRYMHLPPVLLGAEPEAR